MGKVGEEETPGKVKETTKEDNFSTAQSHDK